MKGKVKMGADISGVATNPVIELPSNKVVIALDGLDLKQATELVERVGYRAYAVKIHDLFYRYGAVAIISLKQAGAERVWVDLKFHDIPKTVENSAKIISDHGADILTVHASGGVEMIQAAVDAFEGEVYVVSVLTSLSREMVKAIYDRAADVVVGEMARIAFQGGAHGLVCSAEEVRSLSIRSDIGNRLDFIVPGIRPLGADVGDQKRVGTPRDTLRAGADRLVIGRPITEAADPIAAFEAIEREIASALA